MVGSGPLWSAVWSTGGVLASGVLAGNSATCATLAPACNASPSKPQRYSLRIASLPCRCTRRLLRRAICVFDLPLQAGDGRSEEHTSELQSLMRISYAVFCLKKQNTNHHNLLVVKYSHLLILNYNIIT